jgi:hypothetical protein
VFLFEAKMSHAYWVERATQREYLDWLATQLGVTVSEDWYKVTKNDIISHKGANILFHNQHSIYTVLSRVYPGKHMQL